jgi:hypothetical protein
MPTAPVRAFVLTALGAVLLGCSAPSGPVAPREIRTGVAETAAQYVEASVSMEEVAAAVQAMIAVEPVCTNWPTLWLQDAGRRTLFIVRYDLMTRDWGPSVAQSSTERMEEFVASGFLIKRPRDDLGLGVVEYALTAPGDTALNGSPYTSERPTFCAPAERRLVAVTTMEWGQYPCGNLRVRFSHVSDDWPAWARAESTRARLARTWPALGAEAEGAVTLSRFWRSDRRRETSVGQGELTSVCYDRRRRRIIGGDLELFNAPQ